MNHLSLDSQMLLDLYGGSHEDARFILNDYLDKYDDIIVTFKQAFQDGIESLSKCAHRHSSAFSYIGLPQLTTACKDFELECKEATTTSSVKTSYERLLRVI